MKHLSIALGGGIIGAVMVLAVQYGNADLIGPAEAGKIDPWRKCVVDRMEDVHTDISASWLANYCRQKIK